MKTYYLNRYKFLINKFKKETFFIASYSWGAVNFGLKEFVNFRFAARWAEETLGWSCDQKYDFTAVESEILLKNNKKTNIKLKDIINNYVDYHKEKFGDKPIAIKEDWLLENHNYCLINGFSGLKNMELAPY